MMFSFQLFKLPSFLLVDFFCFGKSAIPVFNIYIKNTISYPNHRDRESNLSGCKEHCHLLATCVHYKEMEGGDGKSYNYALPNFTNWGDLHSHSKEGRIIRFLLSLSGAMDIHAGEKRHQCGKPDKRDEWQRWLPEISQQQGKQIPCTEFRSALISLEMYTGPGPGRTGWQPHTKSDCRLDKRWKYDPGQDHAKHNSGFTNFIKSSFIPLGTYPREVKIYIHTKRCTWMFTAALLAIAKN